MKNTKTLLVMSIAIIAMVSVTGCGRGFAKPILKNISPSQTAILLPLVGQTSTQTKLNSEAFLTQNLVAGKQVEIPQRWLKTDKNFLIWENGDWIPSANLIIVERKPISRNWTSDTTTGTANKNEGIVAETKESIAFSANFNATAQIDESNAVKFLYRYNSATLDSIMDTEIKTRLTTDWVEQCAKYNLEDLLLNKQTIMDNIRKDMLPYFLDRGITITAIGIAGDFTYTNPAIQKAIDDKFTAEKGLETQISTNEITVSKAKADAEAVEIQASTIDKQIQLKTLENQKSMIDKWNGVLPTVQTGNGGIMMTMPTATK